MIRYPIIWLKIKHYQIELRCFRLDCSHSLPVLLRETDQTLMTSPCRGFYDLNASSHDHFLTRSPTCVGLLNMLSSVVWKAGNMQTPQVSEINTNLHGLT